MLWGQGSEAACLGGPFPPDGSCWPRPPATGLLPFLTLTPPSQSLSPPSPLPDHTELTGGPSVSGLTSLAAISKHGGEQRLQAQARPGPAARLPSSVRASAPARDAFPLVPTWSSYSEKQVSCFMVQLQGLSSQQRPLVCLSQSWGYVWALCVCSPQPEAQG